MATKKTPLPTSKAKNAFDLLSDVCKVITEEPKRFNQHVFLYTKSARGDKTICAPKGLPLCGTVGCVAGWIATLKGKRPRYSDTPRVARTILGLTDNQSSHLFWYAAAGDKVQTRDHTKAGVKHIRAFQQEHEMQLKAKRV